MSAVAKIGKPKMRGLLTEYCIRNIAITLVVAAINGTLFHFLVAERRKEKFAEFHRTYDPEEAFERMKAKGVFQACAE